MDKFEYNVRANEIKELIKEGNFIKAADIADTIDWRRVRSIMMLCTVSDVYKINRRYEESRDILLYAYERNPNGRLILYYLCELSIKLGDIVSALEYYKRFVQIAPRDANQFILLYKIYEAQDATLEERINVLEELKRREYKEKWAFELAYLYHLVGQTTLCIEECDELFLWFGKGKYVTKALELKQLHVPLSIDQIKRLNESSQVNTRYVPDNVDGVDYYDESDEEDKDESAVWEGISRFDKIFETDGMNEETANDEEDMDIRIRPVDVSEYNTINLQQEIAENMKELMSDEDTKDIGFVPLKAITEPLPVIKDIVIEEETLEEVYFEDTDEMTESGDWPEEDDITGESENFEDIPQTDQQIKEEMRKGINEAGVIKAFTKSSAYDEILSQDYDGQISLVVPDERKIEKQITGQLKIDDILTEWERQKKEIEQKRVAEVRSKIKEQTANLFNDFDTQTKMGLLEKLEKAMIDAAIKAGPSVIKVADIGAVATGTSTQNLNEPEDEEVRRILEAPDEFVDDFSDDEEGPEEDLDIEDVDSMDDNISMDEDISINGEPEPTEEESVGGEPAKDNQAEEAVTKADTDEEVASETTTEETSTEKTPTEETAPEAAPVAETTVMQPEMPSKDDVRSFTPEEKARFGRFVQHKKIRRQLVAVLDQIKEVDAPGHIIVTGEEGLANMKVVKGIIKEIKNKNEALFAKVVKVSSDTLNKKTVSATFSHITSGIIIIEHASKMKKDSIADLMKILNGSESKLMVILEDSKPGIDELLLGDTEFAKVFPHRIDLNALDNQSLVEYAKNYAFEHEYAIDEFGILALHTRIAEMQTADHEVTTAEIEEIMEEAMYFADRKNPKHFFDILAGKRYDKEDMIILREKDFLH